MAGRTDFFFRQRVTEAELDLAFELLEKADRDLVSDLGIVGIIAGAVPAPHAPVPDLSVDLTAPAKAYNQLGERIFFGAGQTVGVAVDLDGLPTEVTTAGSERWVGVFLRFRRQLSDPRTDGNSQQVFFRRDESFELVVRQAAPAPAGSAQRVPLQPDELLVCEVKRRPGQTQIVSADIDTSRRQVFVFADASAISVVTGGWGLLAPTAPTVQATFDEVDAELRSHVLGTARRHPATQIDVAPRTFITSTNVQAAIHELIDDLSSTVANAAGALRIGADAVAGTPNALPAASVDSQLASLLGFINTHVGATTGAHNATAITAAVHNFLTTTNVQAQLQELVSGLVATASAASGAGRIGVEALTGSPLSLAAGTVRDQLAALLTRWNDHVAAIAGAHPASAILAPAASGVPNALAEAPLATQLSQLLQFINTLAAPPTEARGWLAFDGQNSGTSAQDVIMFAHVNYPRVFATTPTNITFTASSTNLTDNITVSQRDANGFIARASRLATPAATRVFWYGTYWARF
jgi:hypothetical protein